MMRKNYILFLIFLLAIELGALEEKPMWVEFQEAKELFRSGRFEEALTYFIEVTKEDKPFPEAEYMIGLLYLEEGELTIAEEQVKKAISLAPYLEVSVDEIEYKYTLAKIYLLKKDYDNYVTMLKDILGGDKIDLNEVRDRKAYFKALLDSGFDRVLHLYRKKASSVVDAGIYLGYYYNSIGDYKRAVNYLLSPTIALITEVINDHVERDREYLFTSTEDLFNELHRDKRELNYFYEHDFFKLYYYLGESLLGLGYKERAMELWKVLADSNIESLWVNKAKKQLLNPRVETWKFVY